MPFGRPAGPVIVGVLLASSAVGLLVGAPALPARRRRRPVVVVGRRRRRPSSSSACGGMLPVGAQ